MARNGSRTQSSLNTRRILILAGFAALTLCGFSAQAAWTQEVAHPFEARRPEIELERERRAFDSSRPSEDLFEQARRRFEADSWNEKGDGTARERLQQYLGTLSVATESPLRVPLRDRIALNYNPAPPDRSSTDYIRWVQRSLNHDLGSKLSEDGVLSQATRDAIRQFQSRHGLVPDGIVGPKTEAALEGVPISISLREHVADLYSQNLFGSAATQRAREGLMHFGKSEDISSVFDRILGTPAELKLMRGMVFLDVTNRKGEISVAVRKTADSFLNENVAPLNSQENKHAVSSSAELQDLIGDNVGAVVHRGDELPPEWQQELREKRSYLRNTDASPKKSFRAYVKATQLLERTASYDSVRIFSALPNETDRRALKRQLDNMDLNSDEVDGWLRLQGDMGQVQSQSGYRFEKASKEALVEELKNGTNDFVVLIAHHDDGMIHFSNGARMSDAEWAAVSREIAPERTLILLSCTTGVVNGRSLSPSEIVIQNNLALNVMAPEGAISALDVPNMLGDFLIRGKSIRESFPVLHATTLDWPLLLKPKTGPEIAFALSAR